MRPSILGIIAIILWSIIFITNFFIEPTKFGYGLAVALIIFYTIILEIKR